VFYAVVRDMSLNCVAFSTTVLYVAAQMRSPLLEALACVLDKPACLKRLATAGAAVAQPGVARNCGFKNSQAQHVQGSFGDARLLAVSF
jgi:hypothetical protein